MSKKTKHEPKVVPETVRYLRASYSVPPSYVRDESLEFLPEEKDGNYTLLPWKGLKLDQHGPEEPLPDDVQQQQKMEARLRRAERNADQSVDWQAKVIANKVAKLQREAVKVGVDLGPAFQKLIEDAQAEIARKRAA